MLGKRLLLEKDREGYWLRLGGRRYRAAIGKGGIRTGKEEGDGATPVGVWPLRELLFRPDKEPPPATGLPSRAIAPDGGWCDAPEDPNYNRPVRLPFGPSHEKLWREDSLYDLVVPLGYNDDPPLPGKGSAIFLHVAREGYLPTEGCIALKAEDLRQLLPQLSAGDVIEVQAE
jgi:L,D-peptidoglycan transpeptidase YkuD (ErfK/YbiS/YcfS/YnhG family)